MAGNVKNELKKTIRKLEINVEAFTHGLMDKCLKVTADTLDFIGLVGLVEAIFPYS